MSSKAGRQAANVTVLQDFLQANAAQLESLRTATQESCCAEIALQHSQMRGSFKALWSALPLSVASESAQQGCWQ